MTGGGKIRNCDGAECCITSELKNSSVRESHGWWFFVDPSVGTWQWFKTGETGRPFRRMKDELESRAIVERWPKPPRAWDPAGPPLDPTEAPGYATPAAGTAPTAPRGAQEAPRAATPSRPGRCAFILEEAAARAWRAGRAASHRG